MAARLTRRWRHRLVRGRSEVQVVLALDESGAAAVVRDLVRRPRHRQRRRRVAAACQTLDQVLEHHEQRLRPALRQARTGFVGT